MGETHSERERRRREALEWWNTEVQLSSFARHLSADARIVASNPALRFDSAADAESDRWRRLTKIFGPEAAQALRIDLLLAGEPLFESQQAQQPEAATGTGAPVQPEGAAGVGAPLMTPPAADSPWLVAEPEPEQSPLPRPTSRLVEAGGEVPGEVAASHVPAAGSVEPMEPWPAVTRPSGGSAIDWQRVNRANMTPLLDRQAQPPGPPTGALGWLQVRADRLGVSVSAGVGMLAVAVGCIAAVVIAIL